MACWQGAPAAAAELVRLHGREPFDRDDVLDAAEVRVAGDDGAAQVLSESSDETISITDAGAGLQTGGRQSQ